MDPNGTDALFEIIRKELNIIVENGEKKLEKTQNTNKRESKLSNVAEGKDQGGQGSFTGNTENQKQTIISFTNEVENGEKKLQTTQHKNKEESKSSNKGERKDQAGQGSFKGNTENQNKTFSSFKNKVENGEKKLQTTQNKNKKESQSSNKGVGKDQARQGSLKGSTGNQKKTSSSFKNEHKNGEQKLQNTNKESKLRKKDEAKDQIGEGSSKGNIENQKKTSSSLKNDAEKIVSKKDKQDVVKNLQLPRMAAGVSFDLPKPDSAGQQNDETKLEKMQAKYQTTLEKDIALQASFLNSPRLKNIDTDLQRMQLELQDSYNLFQSISEKFETINFQNLSKRIKELNLGAKRDVLGAARTEELKEVVEQGFKTNRMSEMTVKIGQKFSKHPGEFGNIPELSEFFQACTQLEHVLDTFKRQRTDVRDLEERMRKSAEISYNRVRHIKNQLQDINGPKQTRTDDFNDV